jgi:AcrR family transcriptional regulator
MARKYEMKRRAERQKETRRRITEAAVELHQTIGASRTTVSAVAEKAGVQRHTYYAHFPELKDLYQACTAHYLERNPLPDRSAWAEVSDHEERLRVAVSEVYAYYERNEPMLANVFRDAQLDPLVAEGVEFLREYWEGMGRVVADGWNTGGERREALLAAIVLGLDFQTWRTLVRQQELSQDRAVELMGGMVRCLMRT